MKATTSELRETIEHLTKHFDEIVHLSKMYPVVLTFGQERRVFEGTSDVDFALQELRAELAKREEAE